MRWLSSKAGNARYAESFPGKTFVLTGAESSASITTTTPTRFEGCCATTATSLSGTEKQRRSYYEPLDTYETTLDLIESIMPAGREDVFDIQVERTENFIANGLTTHNTRWHEDDLGGYVETLGEAWETIRLPAIAEDGDQLGRAVGEPLCAERYPIEALLEIKNTTPPRWWSALYQQHPVAEEGALWKRHYWQRYKTLPQGMRGCITIDTAGWQRTDTSADRCVLAVWLTDGVRYYVAEVQVGHWEFPEVTRRAKDLKAKYTVPIVVEEVPWSKPLIQTLQAEAGCIPWPVAGKGSKENRARAVVHHAEAMLCYLPESAPWVSDFIEEHAGFPNATHDDQVDTSTMALMYLSRGSGQPKTDRAENVAAYKRTIGKVRA